MAAVTTDMGEVDEIHSKEEPAKDKPILNGDASSSKSSEVDDTENKEEEEEPMDVDEDNNTRETDDPTSVEINDDTNDTAENSEVHTVENSDDEIIDEIVDDDVVDGEIVDGEIVDGEENVDGENVDAENVDEGIVDEENKVKESESIVLNDSGDGDVEIIDAPKENGNSHKIIDDDDDIITIESSSPKKNKKTIVISESPRRSARNANRRTRRSYNDDSDSSEDPKEDLKEDSDVKEESDIEEVLPEDPLADLQPPKPAPTPKKPPPQKTSTIVVKDTKRLAEIASKSSNSNKKEPTLVIIDTNSILSGRGPVPVGQKSSLSSSSYHQSVLPMALPAQGVYPANMRATITPIPMNNSSKNSHLSAAINAPPPTPAPVILPSLTDDMFVVEAPSFIVPYVYEKPPVKDLKETVTSMAKELKEQREREEKERQERKAKGVKDEDDDDDSSCDSKDSKADAPKKDVVDDKKNVLTDIEKRIDDIQKEAERKASEQEESSKKATAPGNSYFKSALGKFFVDIGHSLVQEFVQNDLLRQQKRKRERESGKNPETNKTINSLIKNLEYTKENNEPYHLKLRKCESCSFKTESKLAMSLHLETPHMKNFVYKCNFCPYEVRSPHDILFHMEAEHNVRGRLERAAAFHQCPSCPFEDNQKGKLSRHMVACARKFKPERNMDPPLDWEPPAKIPRVPRMKQSTLSGTAAMYQAMAKSPQFQLMQKMQSAASAAQQNSALNRGRGRPTMNALGKQTSIMRNPANMLYKNPMAGGSVLLPTTYQVAGNQLYQVVGQEMGGRIGTGGPMTFLPNLSSATGSLTIQSAQNKSKPVHQPSISITPLPRNPTSAAPGAAGSSPSAGKPGDSNSKNSFVICEICDGYIKDLEQLRNHMQWIHKVKIHPKMIYNRPPLNCQKCQFRFFTDQGLERHLLGSHGLVTSSMQEAANKSKDAGRCPVCGRVYQWKLLNHVARDHNMTLKPAHLSYKCTVCTATFGMYKQFENHVYSAHSVVAKRVMDKKTTGATASPQNNSAAKSSNDSLLKPLKINDEITIIPQMPKGGPSQSSGKDKDDHPTKNSISVTATPGTSKNELSRAERLARRKSGLDN